MMLDVALFAQLEGLNPLNSGAPVSKSSGLVVKDMMLIIGACLLLAFVLFAGARFYFASKRNQRRHHEHRSHRPGASPAPESAASERDERGRHRRRRRRRVRDHRPRNPTLAETGGLPPQKSPPPAQTAP